MSNEVLAEDLIPAADVETRVYNLTVELAEQERLKKDSMAAFNDEIKRIKAEIKQIIEDQLERDEEAEEGRSAIA